MHPIIAVVTNTDDPEGLGRVEVASPAMGDYWPGWATVMQAFGEPNAAAIPAVGDEVLVTFLHGDATHPVVLGRFKPLGT